MAANPVADGAWEETRRGLLAFIQRRVATPQDAEDLTQDVLVRMQANLARLRESERIGAWAYGIARNAITDYYRDRAKHVDGLGAALEGMRSDSDDDLRSAANSGDAEAELAACMTPFVDKLPDVYRDALRLVELEGVTQVEAARQADISVSGMKSRVQRGRVMVRELLTECCAVQLGPGGGVADYERRDRATACAC